jgi:hypothetical protein
VMSAYWFNPRGAWLPQRSDDLARLGVDRSSRWRMAKTDGEWR